MKTQNALSPPVPVRRLMVVDACAFGRAGLTAALSASRCANALAIQAVPSLSAACQAWRQGSQGAEQRQQGCLVVRLPTEPRAALALLLELGTPASRAALARCMTVLLTPYPVSRVRWLLAAAGADPAIRVVDGRRPVAQLRRAILGASRAGSRAERDTRHVDANPAGAILSDRECRVLLLTLQGVAFADEARRQAISHKTLYSQRYTALLKLGVRGAHGLLSLFGGTVHEAMP